VAPADQPAEGLAQRRRRQRLGPQVPDQPPGLGQVLAGRPPGPLQVAAGLGGVVRQLGLGRLELEDDADEALGQGVVDAAGQRWRSARRPPSRSAAASSLRVASSCSISRRRS
jgi:hypothetical protein